MGASHYRAVLVAVLLTGSLASAQETPSPQILEEIQRAGSFPRRREVTTDTVRGFVRWDGSLPPAEPFEVNEDERFCAPGGELSNDLLVVDPETRGVRDCVVWLERIGGDDLLTTPTPHRGFRPFRMELMGCQFHPKVLVKPTDAWVWIFSQDEVLHQLVLKPPYGVERPGTLGSRGSWKDWHLTAPGVYHVTCTRHPWEKAAIMVARHAFYTVTNEKGGFAFENVPPGRYRVIAWHDGVRVEKRTRAGLVTGYRFSRPLQTEGRLRVPEDTRNPLQLKLRE